MKEYLCSAAVAVGSVITAPVALYLAGFTGTGIAAGSIGAKMMSGAAVANGGGVAAGSIVAILQSLGATGISTGAGAAIGGVTGGVTGVASVGARRYLVCRRRVKKKKLTSKL